MNCQILLLSETVTYREKERMDLTFLPLTISYGSYGINNAC